MNINNTEIERKYLVASDKYRALATRYVRIKQGYLSINPQSTIRIRQWDDQAFLTIKSRAKEGEIAHFEWEKDISSADAEQLFQLVETGFIDKTRYLVPISGNLTCEIDEFHGDNEGLVLAEIELEDEHQSIDLPDFLGEEVTLDKRYYNSYLSQHPYKSWGR